MYAEEKSHVFHETVDALKNLSFCEYISNVPPELSSDFYKRYLHDYINNLSLPFDEEIIESVQKVSLEINNYFKLSTESVVHTLSFIDAAGCLHYHSKHI